MGSGALALQPQGPLLHACHSHDLSGPFYPPAWPPTPDLCLEPFVPPHSP